MNRVKFYSHTVLMKDKDGVNITVKQVLSMIDWFLTSLTALSDINTEPFSTAVKVAKCVERILNNQQPEKITRDDFESFVDVLEKVCTACYPDNKQEFAQKAILSKIALRLFVPKNIS